MALIACSECNGQVSTDAKSCPHCGHALESKNYLTKDLGALGCLYVIAIFAGIGLCIATQGRYAFEGGLIVVCGLALLLYRVFR
jgi:hypothetical protein